MFQEQRVRLWQQSQPSEEIDMFFSHTWQTPGRWKYLVLLFETGRLCFMVAWVVAAGTMTLLCLLGAVPLPFEPTIQILDFEAGVVLIIVICSRFGLLTLWEHFTGGMSAANTSNGSCPCQGVTPTGPWIMLSGTVASVLGLVASPYAPSLLQRDKACFLDKAAGPKPRNAEDLLASGR